MSHETLWVFVPALGWMLYAAGGTWWKGYRRYVWPLVLAVYLWSAGVIWWHAVASAVLLSASYHLGYGDGKTWLRRFLVGACFGLALWPLAIVWWTPIVTSLCFVGLMAWSVSSNRFTWKLAEGATGALHGGLAVWCITTGG